MLQFLVALPIARSTLLRFSEHSRVIELCRKQLEAPNLHLPKTFDVYIQRKGQQPKRLE